MSKVIISLSGIGELYDVYANKQVDCYDPIEDKSFSYIDSGFRHQVCLLQEEIFCTTSDSTTVLNPKVESIEILKPTLPPLPPIQSWIYHKGRAFFSQQYVLDLPESEYFDPDKISLADVNLNRLFGKGIISTRLFYDGHPVLQERAKYILPLTEDYLGTDYLEPLAAYFFNHWNNN